MALIGIEPRNGYAILRLSGDSGLHRLELETLEALQQAINRLAGEKEIQAVVVTGMPEPSFAVGADIRQLQNLSAEVAPRYARLGQDLFASMRNGRQLFLAAIDGHCLGGGLDFALACDLRYATERSRFAHPGARLGIITGFGGTSRLPQTVGFQAAQKLLLAGDTITGSEAGRLGLVEKVVSSENLLTEVEQVAQHIATLQPGLPQLLKELAYSSSRLAPRQAKIFEQRGWDWWEASGY
ncbi:MAG: enoyl-CoA hydratase/isomerase family protein [Blastocatellia bacterium]|nr:enoyl-CoA hydratase/isomerase family protein [Blastocatellia bacterium]